MKIQLSDHFTYGKLFRFCLSPIIMMVFTSIYGVVDGLFVSNFVGKIPFAAIFSSRLYSLFLPILRPPCVILLYHTFCMSAFSGTDHTPAHAGKSCEKVRGGIDTLDHPRPCGEK